MSSDSAHEGDHELDNKQDGSTSLTDTTKTWSVDQWANYKIQIIGGTGIGQVRTVQSNTPTVLTVSSAWATNPDATSVYVVSIIIPA